MEMKPANVRYSRDEFMAQFCTAAQTFMTKTAGRILTQNQTVDLAVKASFVVGFQWGGDATELTDFFVRFKDPAQKNRVLSEALAVYELLHFKSGSELTHQTRAEMFEAAAKEFDDLCVNADSSLSGFHLAAQVANAHFARLLIPEKDLMMYLLEYQQERSAERQQELLVIWGLVFK
jgi:hypothetical protein